MELTLIKDKVDTIQKAIYKSLQSQTSAKPEECQGLASRLTEECERVYSKRQAESVVTLEELAIRRTQACLGFYSLGENLGKKRVDSILKRFSSPWLYCARTSSRRNNILVEDFIQNFYIESLKVLKKERRIDDTVNSRLQVAEYFAFTLDYADRKVCLPKGKKKIAALRAQDYFGSQPQEILVDINGVEVDEDSKGSAQEWFCRMKLLVKEPEQFINESSLNLKLKVLDYLREKASNALSLDYFELYCKGATAAEIENCLNLDKRQRDYLQQQVKYHLMNFALKDEWEAVHEWLGAGIENNFGLSQEQWKNYLAQIGEINRYILTLKQQKTPDSAIVKQTGLSKHHLKRLWRTLLEKAWEARNKDGSGFRLPS